MQAPVLSRDEIDRRMELELQRSQLWPKSKYQAFDIEAFLETHLRAALDQYCELPPDIMGEVVFESGKRPRVGINRDLTLSLEQNKAAWCQGRRRMTVAHEAAHIILHEELFLAKNKKGNSKAQVHRSPRGNLALMGFDKAQEQKDTADMSQEIKWLEWQANQGAAALLMPRSIFVDEANLLFNHVNELSHSRPLEARQRWVISTLADTFFVSRQAAHIRCSTLDLIELPSEINNH